MLNLVRSLYLNNIPQLNGLDVEVWAEIISLALWCPQQPTTTPERGLREMVGRWRHRSHGLSEKGNQKKKRKKERKTRSRVIMRMEKEEKYHTDEKRKEHPKAREIRSIQSKG